MSTNSNSLWIFQQRWAYFKKAIMKLHISHELGWFLNMTESDIGMERR